MGKGGLVAGGILKQQGGPDYFAHVNCSRVQRSTAIGRWILMTAAFEM